MSSLLVVASLYALHAIYIRFLCKVGLFLHILRISRMGLLLFLVIPIGATFTKSQTCVVYALLAQQNEGNKKLYGADTSVALANVLFTVKAMLFSNTKWHEYFSP